MRAAQTFTPFGRHRLYNGLYPMTKPTKSAKPKAAAQPTKPATKATSTAKAPAKTTAAPAKAGKAVKAKDSEGTAPAPQALPELEAAKAPAFASLKALQEALAVGDPKAIHEVRKLSRKVGAELALADAPRKQRRLWRTVRRTAAPLRDHDITGEHISNAMKKLKVPASEIAAFQAAWATERHKHLQDVEWPKLIEPQKPKKLKKKARASLPEQARHLHRSGAEILPTHDSARWHDWRKEMKRYRYTLEVLGDAPRVVKDVLDALGRIQDAEVVMDAVGGPDWKFGHSDALVKQEQAARTRARTKVRQLWPALEAHFEAVAAE